AGVLDISAAFVTWGVRGISPVRILQSSARGLLGRAAMQGGVGTAALGFMLHFVIAFGAAYTYWPVCRLAPALVRRVGALGMLYGVVVFGVMNLVVIPLSAAPSARFTASSLAIAVLTHIFCVGLPIGWAVWRFGGVVSPQRRRVA